MRKQNPVVVLTIMLIDVTCSILLLSIDVATLRGLLEWVGFLVFAGYLYFESNFQGGLKNETGEGESPWGHVRMTFLTLGIYHVYWTFAAGKRLAIIGAKDRSILYVAISVVPYLFSMVYIILYFLRTINYLVIISFGIINIVMGLSKYVILMHMQYTANRLLRMQESNMEIYR